MIPVVLAVQIYQILAILGAEAVSQTSLLLLIEKEI